MSKWYCPICGEESRIKELEARSKAYEEGLEQTKRVLGAEILRLEEKVKFLKAQRTIMQDQVHEQSQYIGTAKVLLSEAKFNQVDHDWDDRYDALQGDDS